MKKQLSLLLACVLALSLSACAGSRSAEPTATKTNILMDTVVTITFYDDTDPAVLELAFEEVARLENLLSASVEGSDIDRLNRAAGREWVTIAPETEEVLRLAGEFSALSEGAFDVTAGPLIDLWDINGGGHYPDREELDHALALVGWEDLLVEEGKAFLAREGMEVNLGAIAKGYIADRVKLLLLDQGVEHATLDLGRNVLLIGEKADGVNFNIGVNDPNTPEQALVGALSVADKSLVTSGINERYFVHQGTTYHHILDPFTGFPSENEIASVTILSDSSAHGDALSTTCFLLGEERGLALVESLEGIEALYIRRDGTMTMTDGMGSLFTPME